MDQPFQIKSNRKTSCKNDRKSYLQTIILTRMGSFNSSQRINNFDSEDDALELPKGLKMSEILLYIKELRGDQYPPLLTRRFLNSPGTFNNAAIIDGLRGLHLNKISQFAGVDGEKSNLSTNYIRIFQWNILSQTLGENNDGFVCCPEAAIVWENRKYLIAQEILQYNADIICLQEVDHFKFLEKVLGTQNYEGIFYPKPDSPCLYVDKNNGPDGCAIFFKCDKFSMESFETRVLEVWRVQSNQVAIAALFQIRSTGRKFCVCTTHLKARRDPILIKLRNEQGRDLIRFVKNFANEQPVLLCGDFNAEPTEPVYSTILNCDIIKFSSAYADIRMDSKVFNNKNVTNYDFVSCSIKNEPPYTTWKIRQQGEECHTIDYVFYTREKLKIKNVLEFPQSDEIGKNRTPSLQYPSDHFSLVCDFELFELQKSEN